MLNKESEIQSNNSYNTSLSSLSHVHEAYMIYHNGVHLMPKNPFICFLSSGLLPDAWGTIFKTF